MLIHYIAIVFDVVHYIGTFDIPVPEVLGIGFTPVFR